MDQNVDCAPDALNRKRKSQIECSPQNEDADADGTQKKTRGQEAETALLNEDAGDTRRTPQEPAAPSNEAAVEASWEAVMADWEAAGRAFCETDWEAAGEADWEAAGRAFCEANWEAAGEADWEADWEAAGEIDWEADWEAAREAALGDEPAWLKYYDPMLDNFINSLNETANASLTLENISDIFNRMPNNCVDDVNRRRNQ